MPHDVELTVIRLHEPPLDADTLASFLSDDERERAARFKFPELQKRFRVGRGMLRLRLGHVCGVTPDRITFAYSSFGKPSLPDFPDIHFNASHSGHLWACAIGGTSPLGLDIEEVRPMRDLDGIAQRFFAPEEWNAIRIHDSDEPRLTSFFRCWTRKEAYIKALGDGLSRGLATFTVSCEEQEFSVVEDSLSPERYSIRSFVPAPGYQGALATRGEI